MVATDPRATLKGFFNSGDATCKVTAANLTLEDASNAKFESTFEYPNIDISDLFLHPHHVDIEFLIRDLGVDPPVYGASGPLFRICRVGIQPVILDKWTAGGVISLDATKLIFKAQDEIYTVLDAYYTADDKVVGRTIPAMLNPGREGLLYGPTVESLTKIYMYSVATGTESIQRWTSIKVGYDATHHTELTDGILDFRYSRTHPAARKDVANTVSADDLVQHHSNFVFQVTLDGDNRDMFFAQDVQVAGGNQFALDDDADSNKIEYFLVTAAMRGPTGTVITRTYTIGNGYILANSYDGNNRFTYTGDAETITAVDV